MSTLDVSIPIPTRTVVFVAMAGPVTTIKALIFERLLCTSPFDVVVGVDVGQTNATSSSVLSLIRAAQQRTNTNVTHRWCRCPMRSSSGATPPRYPTLLVAAVEAEERLILPPSWQRLTGLLERGTTICGI